MTLKKNSKVTLTVPTLGSKALAMTPHVKEKEDGTESLSFVLLPPNADPADSGRGFRGWRIPVSVDDIGGLPETAILTVGSGKSKTTVDLPTKSGTTKSGNPRQRADRTLSVGDATYRVAFQVSETKNGEVYIIATVIPGGGGGGMTSEGNPFA